MLLSRLAGVGFVLALCVSALVAQDNPAVKPINRDVKRHKDFLEKVKSGEGDVIFVGDSITQGWEGKGAKKVWDDTFGPFKPVNLGIGGDQTGHVLWRLTEGKEIEPLKPKLAVVMIGTNNASAKDKGGKELYTPENIAGGVKAIIDELQKQKPDMKILLLGVFPRAGGVDKGADAPKEKLNPKIKQINDIISKYADGKKVIYKDIGDKFLNKDGGLERKVMPDLLHLSEEGYKIWADAVKDDIAKLLK